jgi:hypothetical protein
MKQLNLNFIENIFIDGKEYRLLTLLGRYKHIKTFINDLMCEGYDPGSITDRYFLNQEEQEKEFIDFYHQKIVKEIHGVKYYGLRDKNIYDNLKK